MGAARATLDSLVEQDLVGALTDRVQGDRVPFLGICIGLQVLFDHSEEGDTDGLGWVPGTVRRFPETGRVPQIGWNEVRFTRPHPVTAGVPDAGHYYFVNSYYCAPTDPADVLGLTDYTVEFCSVVGARTTWSPPSSTPRRAARSASRSCAASPAWEPSC